MTQKQKLHDGCSPSISEILEHARVQERAAVGRILEAARVGEHAAIDHACEAARKAEHASIDRACEAARKAEDRSFNTLKRKITLTILGGFLALAVIQTLFALLWSHFR